jgi:hypothetical protein
MIAIQVGLVIYFIFFQNSTVVNCTVAPGTLMVTGASVPVDSVKLALMPRTVKISLRKDKVV